MEKSEKKDVLIYPAIFRKEEKNGYSVFIPDLDSATCGEDLQEAIFMAKDLIGGMAIEYKEYEKKEMPKASAITDVKLEQANDFVTLVDVDYEQYKKSLVKSIKKTVYISKDLNDKAESLHINFSQTLQDALTELVAQSR